jgi:hypothetical protein
MSNKIEFDITLSDVHQMLIDDVDFSPYILCYLSRELDPYGLFVKTIEFSQIDNGKTMHVVIPFDPMKNEVRKSECVVGMMLYRRKYIDTEKKRHRYEPVGRFIIPFDDMMTKGQSRQKKYVARDETDTKKDPYRATFTVSNIVLRNNFTIYNDVQDTMKYLAKVESDFSQFYDYYVKQYTKLFESSDESLYGRLHVPSWFTTIKIPSVFFLAYFPRKEPDLKFLEYLIESVLRSNGLSVPFFLNTVNEQMKDSTKTSYDNSFTMCIKIVASTCTWFANACDYLSDKSLNDDTERFVLLDFTFAGDCEDSARDAYLMWNIIRQSRKMKDVEKFRLTYAASLITELYVCGLTTCGASMMSMEEKNADKMETSENVICHMISTVLPRKFFAEALQRGYADPDAKNFKQRATTYESISERLWEDKLPVLIMEGTNWCNSLQLPLNNYVQNENEKQDVIYNQSMIKKAKSYLDSQQNAALKKIPSEIIQTNITLKSIYDVKETKASSFYRRMNNFITVVDGYGMRDFSIVNVNTGKYSVDFRDYISKKPTIGLVPVYILSPEQESIGLKIIDLEIPSVIRLMPNKYDLDKLKRLLNSNEHYVRLYQLSLKYPIDNFKKIVFTCVSVIPFTRNFISYRFNTVHKLNKKIIDTFESVLSKNNDANISFDALSIDTFTICNNELYVIEVKLYISEKKIK